MMAANRGPTWDGITAEELERALQLPRLELRAEVESTQDIAHALAEQGTPDGTFVLADAQRAGRGRMGRSWASELGAGIWCTMIFDWALVSLRRSTHWRIRRASVSSGPTIS
jgi:hypothetical protein